MTSRITSGGLVLAIGTIHNVIGIALTRPHLREILADGYVNAVPDDAPWRLAAFWFLWFGWGLMLLGASWHHMERRGVAVPRWAGAVLFAIGLAGGLAMPASGFWLVLPVCALVFRRA